MSTLQGKSEWDALTEVQRNCLIWPDFLKWGTEHDVEIKRERNSDLGIISVALIDVESTNICYNIIKQVLEGKPASGKVNLYDWITAVDEASTLRIKGSKELVSLIKNEKDTVRLSTRTAIEPLVNIKQWNKEQTKVQLKDLSKKPEFELAHFYSKGDNENIEDHILIFKVESKSTGAESTPLSSIQQLNRGDELLSVNGKPVRGKKLKEIYELIFKSSKVEMEIKKIIRGEAVKELADSQGEGREVVAAPAAIKQQNQGRRKRSQEKRSQASSRLSESSSSDENLSNSNPNPVNLEEDASISQDVSCDSSGVKEPLSPTRTESDGGSRSRGFSFGKKPTPVPEYLAENDAYSSSDSETKKNVDLCTNCDKLEEDGHLMRLAKHKSSWSLDWIDRSSYQKICDALDRDKVRGGLGEVVDKMEFPSQYFYDIKQKYSGTGGFGAANEILKTWTAKKQSNVKEFRKILVTLETERADIIGLIDEWLAKGNICNGCGCVISTTRK